MTELQLDLTFLTRGWQKECYMLAVVDRMLWATLGVLLGRNINIVNNHMVMYV